MFTLTFISLWDLRHRSSSPSTSILCWETRLWHTCCCCLCWRWLLSNSCCLTSSSESSSSSTASLSSSSITLCCCVIFCSEYCVCCLILVSFSFSYLSSGRGDDSYFVEDFEPKQERQPQPRHPAVAPEFELISVFLLNTTLTEVTLISNQLFIIFFFGLKSLTNWQLFKNYLMINKFEDRS